MVSGSIEPFASRCAGQVCQACDPKGLYALAAAGRADRRPGLGVPYGPPLDPEAAVDTAWRSAGAAAAEVLAQLDAWLLLYPIPIQRSSQ